MFQEVPSFRGVIIKSFESGERDLVVHVLTEERGRVGILAKHARASRGKFGRKIDLFEYGRFEVAESSRGMLLLKAFHPENIHRSLRSDLGKFISASALMDVVDLLFREESPLHDETWVILELSLAALNEAKGTKELLRVLYIATSQLMSCAGIYDSSKPDEPSARELRYLFSKIEEFAERELRSKGSVFELVETLRNTESSS